MKSLLTSLFGKYRELVLFIAVFLLIDASVSAINIYTSRQIEDDAGRINTAGLLSTYAQQLTKSLLTLDMEMRTGASNQTSLAQISEARLAFNEARDSLAGKLAEPPLLSLIEPAALRQETVDALDHVTQTWAPIDREVTPLLLGGVLSVEMVNEAMQKAVNRNNRLTQQAEDLSLALQKTAREKTSTVRLIQIIAIGLALLNFGLIVFKFIGRLAASDRETVQARQETERILGSVREGLFLLTRERTVGGQRSNSLAALFGRPLDTGDNFHHFLGRLCAPEHAQAAEDYIDLLFNRKIKQSLLEQLNPLKEIELLADGRSRKGPSYLTFEFSQVRENDEVVALLVTVFDVSQKVRLERELAGAEARAKGEVELLLGVLDHDPDEVAAFLQRTRDTLQQINGELQDIQPGRQSYAQLVNKIARTVHGLKGEAGTLGCTGIAQEAHDFEEKLLPLRGRRDLAGDDLIPVAVALSRLLGEILKLEAVVNRVQHFAAGRAGGEARPDPLWSALQRVEQFALQVAEDLNKKVRFEAAVPRLDKLPPALAGLLREALPQLIRNAIAHGIETPDERQRLGKPSAGLVRVELTSEADGSLTMTVHDDGRGISPEHLRTVLVARHTHSPEEIAALSDEQIIAMLFEPGFSSLASANLHAGRGDGLSVVKEALRDLGGRLRVSSRANSHTRFIMQLKAA